MRLRVMVAVVLVLVLVVGIGVYIAASRFRGNLPASTSSACEVSTPAGAVSLHFDQMANAATITAVGLTKKLPDRGIVVALATALQESKLENLAGGDRDSIGLFQQRPSQGWGDPDQISDPRYAATKFYNALVRVRGWQDMRVTDAAQRVQRSAFPEAYEKWADEAEILTEALTGRSPGAVTCGSAGEPLLRGLEATDMLGHGLRQDWGNVETTVSGGVGLGVRAASERAGWRFAHWIVAHSASIGVQRVQFGSREWTADRGAWTDVALAPTDLVLAEVYSGE